jgi:hypothetical protein
MISQYQFLQIAATRPEMKRAFQDAVNAVVKFRSEAAKPSRGLLAGIKLKGLGVRAAFLTEQLISGFTHDGVLPNEQDKEAIRGWVNGAADYQRTNSN